jgi:hypothetical protein
MTDEVTSLMKCDFLSTRHKICNYKSSGLFSYSKERTGRNIFPSEELSFPNRSKNGSEKIIILIKIKIFLELALFLSVLMKGLEIREQQGF